MADGLLALDPPPFSENGLYPLEGEDGRRADGHPQLPVSAQMAAPTPISVPYSGYGGTSTCY